MVGGFDSNTILALTRNFAVGHSAGLALNSGTSATSFIHLGDADDPDIGKITYDHTNNSMSFTSNATERLRIDSNGNTLVNVNSATAGSYTYKLLTSDNISSSEQTFGIQYPAVVTYGLNAESNADFTIKKDGTERLRIRSDGKISVGTNLNASNTYEFSLTGADGTGGFYAHGSKSLSF